MSSSDNFDVQQKKDPTTVVTWNEYEALRDHLQRQILTATNPIHENVQNVELSLNEATETITETQQQVTDIQRTLNTLQQAMATLQASVDRQQDLQPDDDGEASVHGENADGATANATQAAAARRERVQQAAQNRRIQNDPVNAGQGGGRGNVGRGFGRASAMPVGRGFAPLGARRVIDDDFAQQDNREDDGLGKPSVA